jgi:hypothetical protein
MIKGVILEHSLNGSFIVGFLFRPWSNKYLVYLWCHGTFFNIIHLYLFLTCLRSAPKPLDSLRSAGSVRRFSIQSNTKQSLISAGGKSENPSIFFANWLTSKVFTACRDPRFHFPPPALKNDRRTQLVNLACKPCSPIHLNLFFQYHPPTTIALRQLEVQEAAVRELCKLLFLQAHTPYDSAPTHCTSRSCKGISQSAWRFPLTSVYDDCLLSYLTRIMPHPRTIKAFSFSICPVPNPPFQTLPLLSGH